MKNKKVLKISLILSIILFILTFLGQIYTTRTYYQMEKVNYYNLDELKINAKYYPGKIDKGIVFVNDLSKSSKDYWIMIDEFRSMGYHLFVMDFPSQGYTKGQVEYNYKNNQYLAEQYYTGVVTFSQITRLSEDNLHIVAAGTGARVALQTATKHYFAPKDMTLIGTQTNINEKIQLDVVNFVKESDVMFINALNEYNPGGKIHLVCSALDDKSDKAENEKLMEYMSRSAESVGSVKNDITFDVFDKANPNMLRDSNVIKSVVNYIAKGDGITYNPSSTLQYKNIITIVLCILALAIIMISAKLLGYNPNKDIGQVDFTKRVLISKAIALIPSLILIFLLPVGIYLLLGSVIPLPYFSLLKSSLICCYGMVLFYLYYKTNYCEDIGSYIFASMDDRSDTNVKGGVLVLVLSLLLMVFLSIGGVNIVFQIFSYKLFWLILLSVLFYFIFYIDEREKSVIYTEKAQGLILSAFNFGCIVLVTFILLLMGRFYLMLEHLAVCIMIVYVLAIGRVLKAINSPTYLNSAVKAVILSIFLLSTSVLFF